MGDVREPNNMERAVLIDREGREKITVTKSWSMRSGEAPA